MEYIADLEEKKIQNTHGFEFSGYDLMFSRILLQNVKTSLGPDHNQQ